MMWPSRPKAIPPNVSCLFISVHVIAKENLSEIRWIWEIVIKGGDKKCSSDPSKKFKWNNTVWEIFIPTLSHSCNSFISFLKFFIFYFLNLYFIKNKYNCRPLVGWKLKQENIIFFEWSGWDWDDGKEREKEDGGGGCLGGSKDRTAGWFLGRGRKGKEKEETGQQRFFFWGEGEERKIWC